MLNIRLFETVVVGGGGNCIVITFILVHFLCHDLMVVSLCNLIILWLNSTKILEVL